MHDADESAALPTSSSARALGVLSTVATAGRAVSLAELSAALNLPKATAHRLCSQLVDLAWLARDVDERSYVVGSALRKLAFETLNHGSLRALRHEVLAALVAQVGETCNFTTLDGASVLYLDRVEAPWPWRLTLEAGTHVPLHCTASGKLFLAHMAEAERESVLAHLPLQPLTPQTLVTPAALRQECQDILRQGYSIDREEFVPGLVAAAVAVTDPQGRVRAAVAVHAPSSRMSVGVAEGAVPRLREAAARMRELL